MVPFMEMRRKAAAAVVGVLALAVLTGCTESPGPGRTKSWCDHGNRLYTLDTSDTRGETLAVAPEDVTCDQDRQDVTIRPEGDTLPMPEVEGVQEGPYKPWKPPTPKPNPKPVAPKVAPKKSSTYRLMPEAR